MNRIVLSVMCAAFACNSAVAATKDNAALGTIFAQDQQARQHVPIDWSVVAPEDRAHRVRVLEMLKAGKLRTSLDYYRAAMVFQHGEQIDDIRLAFSLAQISVTLDPGTGEPAGLPPLRGTASS